MKENDPYAHSATVYDATIAVDSHMTLRELFDDLRRDRLSGYLLDIGCGTGQLLRYAMSCGWSVCGIEPSAPMRAVIQSPGATPLEVVYSLNEIPNRTWDLVFAHGDVMNYLLKDLSLSSILSKIYKALPSGGLFAGDFVTTFDILHHWNDCCNIYERPGVFRLEVSHFLQRRKPVYGGIRRRFLVPSSQASTQWTELWMEHDMIRGIEPSTLRKALRSRFHMLKWYDWESRRLVKAQSGRIGFIVQKP